MPRILRLPAAILAFSALSFPAFSADAPQQEITSRILMPLEFGEFTSDRSGSVTIDPRSGACRPSGVVMMKARCSFATVEIRGEPGDMVVVEMQPEASLQNSEKGGQMMVNNFTMNRENPITLGADGREIIQVGATLNTGSKQSSGRFLGGFNVMVNRIR